MSSADERLTASTCVAMIVVAHPDDETLGAASLLLRQRGCRLIHATDGAPRARRFRTHGRDDAPPRSRRDYARQRHAELGRALEIAGIDEHRASSLGIVDMEVALSLASVARQIGAAIDSARPDFVVTHDYAGGHPDHDALAWAVRAATDQLAHRGLSPPPIYEMALYHGADGRMTIGEFLPRLEPIETIELALTRAEQRRKREMLDAFASQRETLRPFHALEVERFRLAPRYDFSRPPHARRLLYERWGFPLTGERWRSLAARATATLDEEQAA